MKEGARVGVGGGHRGPVVLLGDGRVARLSLSLSILLDVLSLVFSLCLTAPGQGQQLPCTQVPACGGEKLSKSGGGDAVEKLWVAELGAVGCPPPTHRTSWPLPRDESEGEEKRSTVAS